MNLKPLLYTNFCLILAGAAWISGCARPLNPVDPIPLKPATSTPTVSATPSATPTTTLSITATPTTTASVTTTPSACVTVGNYLPSPAITQSVTPGAYVANSYSGAGCAATYNEMKVFVGNFSSGAASFEVAVYDNSQLAASAWATITGPTGYSQTTWDTIPLTAFTIGCGDKVTLAFLAGGAGSLYLGVGPGGSACDTDEGGTFSSLPASYPNAGFLTTPTAGECWSMSLDSCGPP